MKKFNESLTTDEIEKQTNEWLLKKYVWMKRELGAIVNVELKNVESEILRRMEKEQEVEKWKSSERIATSYVGKHTKRLLHIKDLAVACDADGRTIQPHEILDLLT